MLELLKTAGMGFLFILLFLFICGILVAMIFTFDGFIALTDSIPWNSRSHYHSSRCLYGGDGSKEVDMSNKWVTKWIAGWLGDTSLTVSEFNHRPPTKIPTFDTQKEALDALDDIELEAIEAGNAQVKRAERRQVIIKQRRDGIAYLDSLLKGPT